MSADGTELTFVRCAACGSLVPAVSPECKMCGTPLESAPAKEGKASKASSTEGRVRQRTVTAGEENLNSVVDKIRTDYTEDDMVAEPSPPPASMESDYDEELDPLRDYIEEVDVNANGKTSHTGEDTMVQRRVEPQVDIVEEDFPEPVQASEVVDEIPSEPTASFAEEVEAEIEEEVVEEEAYITTQEEEENKMNEAKAPERKAAKVKPGEDTTRKLVGWLVNFADSSGLATEIREGRYFVTSERLKPSDLVIEDSSLSMPHALLKAGPGGMLKIQDLMSENGTLARKKGAKEFEKIDESFEVEHGDWVKFGDLEYMICLIAHVGET